MRIGDLLLRQVASRLQSRVRQSDTLARLGGDEFAVVITGEGAGSDAAQVAAALLEVLTPPFLVEEHEIAISASIGSASFRKTAQRRTLLLQQADSAMYAAKKLGKNRMVYFSPELGASLRERLHLENAAAQRSGAMARSWSGISRNLKSPHGGWSALKLWRAGGIRCWA